MSSPTEPDQLEGRLEWFGGNEHALHMFNQLCRMSHIWDDIVDRDKELSGAEVNEAFLIALVYLPNNPFYQSIEREIRPMMLAVTSAFETANTYERVGDEHGIEIGHVLRYAAGFIVAYMVEVCVGRKKAQEYMPDVWKVVVAERFDEYRAQHIERKKVTA